MIKKMVLEDAKYWGKSLCIMDIDFSKAYDSTRHFAKEISMETNGHAGGRDTAMETI